MIAIHIPRQKLLVPIPKWQWREPSRAIERDQCGNLIEQHRWRLSAKTHDGVTVWTGWFDDREELDAFLFAMATGVLAHETPLWELPKPHWPDLPPDMLYAVQSVNFYTSTTTANATIPIDWRNDANKIECVGAGGSQGISGVGNCAGAAGCYSGRTNYTITPGSYNYRCGITAGTYGAGTSYTYNTWFKDGSTVLAVGGPTAPDYYNGGNSVTTNCVGTTIYKGGDGGDYYGTNAPNGGAGGAGGPNGAGVRGDDNNTGYARVKGGAGDAGYGGAGGQQSSSGGTGYPGSNGAEWDATHGCGGGGGGGSNGYYEGAAGSYGGAGNPGKQGLLVITYTPRFLGMFSGPPIGG